MVSIKLQLKESQWLHTVMMDWPLQTRTHVHPWHPQWALLLIKPLWVQHMGAPEDALMSLRIVHCDFFSSFSFFIYLLSVICISNLLSYAIIMKARFYLLWLTPSKEQQRWFPDTSSAASCTIFVPCECCSTAMLHHHLLAYEPAETGCRCGVSVLCTAYPSPTNLLYNRDWFLYLSAMTLYDCGV